ncbi:MAG: hypothetical protein ACI8T1_004940 [Verrucomicrobiales bacterium]|jgi:hypothetical protein
MKARFALSILTTALTLSFATAKEVEWKKHLPGKYKLTYSGTFLSLEAVKSYHSDGTYESVGKAKILGIEKKLVHRGRWKLQNGELIYILSQSSTPSNAPIGVPLKFKVLSHDGKTLRYRDQKRNKNYSEKRIGDAKKEVNAK